MRNTKKDTIEKVLKDVWNHKCGLSLAETRIMGIQLTDISVKFKSANHETTHTKNSVPDKLQQELTARNGSMGKSL